jgi:membrane associated rhomboid family serine protease
MTFGSSAGVVRFAAASSPDDRGMFFIPYSTDAPLYYRPFVTIGLIVANVAAFVVTRMGEAADGWLLQFGRGLHPTEWFASAFLHFGFLHLLGNLLFLWTFGLIVEGKLGWWRFLLLYLLLCGLDGALTQAVMLSYDGDSPGAGGASGVIFALMAIALIWAPRNCIDVLLVYWLGLFVRTSVVEVTVFAFSLCYIGLNFLMGWLGGFAMSSATLHLLGAGVGAPVGTLLLVTGLVDCEHWDLFTLLRGKPLAQDAASSTGPNGVSRNAPFKSARRHPAPLPRRSAVKLQTEQVRRAVDAGQFLAAWSRYEALRAESLVPLDEPTLKALIDGVHRERDWRAAATLLEDYIARFPDSATRARLMLAGLYVQEQQRPRAALSLVERIDPGPLSPAQRDFLQKVRDKARAQISSGVLELSVPSTS